MLSDQYVPSSMMGVGNTYVLLELSVRFTIQQLIPRTYVANVNFQGVVLKMKMNTFQNYLKILTLVIPQEEFYILSYFRCKIPCQRRISLQAVDEKEPRSGIFQRSLAEGHCWFTEWQSDILSHTCRSSANSSCRCHPRLAPESLARIWHSYFRCWWKPASRELGLEYMYVGGWACVTLWVITLHLSASK